MKIKEKQNIYEGKTAWSSLTLCFVLLALNGIQFSVYMTSAWPYLKMLDHGADLRFFGWIMSAYSFGQMISCWAFGCWSQKTSSTRHPAICGLLFCAFGNTLYGLIPSVTSNRKWYMLFARLLNGWGTGTLSLIRSYCAMASTQKDRARVVSLATGFFTLGISVGPTIQTLFIPLGTHSTRILFLHINMYTAPAFAMVAVCMVGILLLVTCFKENYAGIMSENMKNDPFVVIPKFDRTAAYTCIYMCFALQTAITGLEVISTPLAVSLYNWTNEQAIFYNGILQTCSSVINVINYGILSFTRIRKIDMRYLLFSGILCFIVYELLMLPWPFYSGPLDYIELAPNSTIEDATYSGGCYRHYKWCSYTTRVPLHIYVLTYVAVLGFGFPLYFAPTGIIFSEVLGPRKQGMMQGLFAFFGCSARCITPIYQTFLFKQSGYLFPNLINFTFLIMSMTFLTIFRKKMVPLKLIPKLGVATRYKAGIFYRL